VGGADGVLAFNNGVRRGETERAKGTSYKARIDAAVNMVAGAA